MRCALNTRPLGLVRVPMALQVATPRGARAPAAAARRASPCPPPRAVAADSRYQTDDNEAITLPLNFYSLLHCNRTSSREAIKRAFERIANAPPDVGYSQDTLFSRAVLLKSAAECLADLDARRAYDAAAAAAGGAHTVGVSRDNLPGALVLLQEAGESALVLDLGCEWLETHRRAGGAAARAADVAAAVALALCDLAAADLEGAGGGVAGACERLEEALALLRAHGLAPQLQQQIGDTLEVGRAGGAGSVASVVRVVKVARRGARANQLRLMILTPPHNAPPLPQQNPRRTLRRATPSSCSRSPCAATPPARRAARTASRSRGSCSSATAATAPRWPGRAATSSTTCGLTPPPASRCGAGRAGN
jgi:hypothetical protein